MRTKIMRPHDIRPYCNINPQAIREGMKAGKLDIGFAVQQNGGQRWTYVIIPEKFLIILASRFRRNGWEMKEVIGYDGIAGTRDC